MTVCDVIHRKILEAGEATLSGEEKQHLHECAVCAETADDVAVAGSILAAMARQADAEIGVRPRPELKEKVRARVRGATHLTGGASGARAQSARVIPVEPAHRRRLARILVAAVAVFIAFIGIRGYVERRPIGSLEYATAAVDLQQGAVLRHPRGVGAWEYHKGSVLATPDNVMSLFSLGERVRGALAGSTRLAMLDDDDIELTEGAVWVHVQGQGKGFRVRSPHGIVQVTGTRFGVAVAADETLVEVVQGTVIVGQGDKKSQVSAGEMLRLTSTAIGPVSPRPGGRDLPPWVTALAERHQKAAAGQFVPSLTVE